MPQFDTTFFSSLIFWEVISFAVLFWILYKFAFPPILEALETRERKIRDSLEQAERQISRAPRPLPTMTLNPGVRDIFGFAFEDFVLSGYDPHPHIAAPVAV